MGKKIETPQNSEKYPDTTRNIQDLVGPVLDNLVEKYEGGSEAVREEAVKRAQRRLATKHTDTAHEIAGIEGETAGLEDEFNASPTLEVRDALEDTHRNYKAAKAEQDSLPPRQE